MWEKKIACSGSGSEWEGRRGGVEGGVRAHRIVEHLTGIADQLEWRAVSSL